MYERGVRLDDDREAAAAAAGGIDEAAAAPDPATCCGRVGVTEGAEEEEEAVAAWLPSLRLLFSRQLVDDGGTVERWWSRARLWRSVDPAVCS